MTNNTLKQDTLKLLKQAVVTWEHCEFGAPTIDCKRPYGNSDVHTDIAEILVIKAFVDHNGEHHFSGEQVDYMDKVHANTKPVLEEILRALEDK